VLLDRKVRWIGLGYREFGSFNWWPIRSGITHRLLSGYGESEWPVPLEPYRRLFPIWRPARFPYGNDLSDTLEVYLFMFSPSSPLTSGARRQRTSNPFSTRLPPLDSYDPDASIPKLGKTPFSTDTKSEPLLYWTQIGSSFIFCVNGFVASQGVTKEGVYSNVSSKIPSHSIHFPSCSDEFRVFICWKSELLHLLFSFLLLKIISEA
jgi:hypothetical protein